MCKRQLSFSLPVVLLGLLAAVRPAGAQVPAAEAFGVQGDHFALNGKPFQIIAGSMHYTRIPRAAWHDRLRKARAMGLNTIETYTSGTSMNPAPESSTSAATTTSPSSSARPSRRDCTSSCAPARTSAPSGSSAAMPPGC